jgi:hypothetical protein
MVVPRTLPSESQPTGVFDKSAIDGVAEAASTPALGPDAGPARPYTHELQVTAAGVPPDVPDQSRSACPVAPGRRRRAVHGRADAVAGPGAETGRRTAIGVGRAAARFRAQHATRIHPFGTDAGAARPGDADLDRRARARGGAIDARQRRRAARAASQRARPALRTTTRSCSRCTQRCLEPAGAQAARGDRRR